VRSAIAGVLMLACIASPASARTGPVCQGRYVLDTGAFRPDVTAESPDAIEIEGRTVAIPGVCKATRGHFVRRRGRLRVRARWSTCGALEGVRLRATADTATCGTMTGSIAARTPVLKTPFSATRAVRLLVFTRTEEFRHASIADAVRVLGALPVGERITVSFTEEATAFTDEGLAAFDVVAFVNTTGDVLNPPEERALERFVHRGRGFVGVHAAADTEHDWPWYGRLVGAYFLSHPQLPVEVTTTTEDRSHPATAHLPPTFQFIDEIYNFDRNPRPDNTILLTIDEAGFIYPNVPPTPSMGADHPVAWCKDFEGGRSFYTTFGHRAETWDDPRFQRHLLAAVRWAAFR
jgi:type 1 glutamine amidotransferase